jgi:N-dimethylarginine dimethylaminohydrolase
VPQTGRGSGPSGLTFYLYGYSKNMTNIIIHKTNQVASKFISTLPKINRPNKLFMTDPSHFEIIYTINPHTKLKTINKKAALSQWTSLKTIFKNLNIDVSTIPSQPSLPDMVFCANAGLPFLLNKKNKGIILSNMYNNERKEESTFFQKWFKKNTDFTVLSMPSNIYFEGAGDALWHPHHYLLWGGFGIRTDKEAFNIISKKLNISIITLELCNEHFFHLDTCLCLLNENTALFYPEAFTQDSQKLINKLIKNIIPVSKSDALNFACNAYSPDEKHVILQKGSKETIRNLKIKNFIPIEIETHEFICAGGSVSCLKLSAC